MKKKNTAIRTVLFLSLLVLMFYGIYAGTHSFTREKPELEMGHANLLGFDLENKLAILPASYFVYYPNVLYTPETFPQVLSEENKVEIPLSEWESYGTYRMLLELPAGKEYGIRAFSALHSQRLYINGEELSLIGMPGTSADTTIPETGYYTVTFTPETDQTEILIQTASFHYGGGLFDLILGTAENVSVRSDVVMTRIHLTQGTLITIFFLSAGLYLFFNRRSNLWFALACVAVFVRISVMEENNLLDLLFRLSWENATELKCLSTIALGFFFVLYIKDSFPKVFRCGFVTVFGVGCLLTALMVILTPVSFFISIIYFSLWGSWLFLTYAAIALTIHIIRRRKTLRADQVLPYAEFMVFTMCFLLDLHFYRYGAYNKSMGLVDLGTVICIHINTIVPIIDYSRTVMERDKVRLAEKEIRDTNLLLDRLNRVRAEFLQNLSHELRTPLTVMSNCAGLTALQIHQNSLDEDTLENMGIIKQEATRLGQMVEQIKEISVEKEWRLTLTDTDIQYLLKRTADFCEPICRKNDNIISIEAPEFFIVLVNEDAIFQVLLNLIINANRHTKQDTILLKAEPLPEGNTRISVTDHGEGIPSHILPRIYERHVSGDGGSGLGIPICKEIIEQHGGTMEIQSLPGRGTVIYLIIPGGKEESDGDTTH